MMMKNKKINEANLKANELKALREFKSRLLEKFSDAEITLYGSKARGDSTPESDIDLLILMERPVTNELEEAITKISYAIELKYDVVFGKLVKNRNFWNTSLANVMPIHRNIDREGIAL
ncbi:MAG: nucleotidyltransferase domain-containing protein [Elusimicrobiota bacterium]|nr:nucleotidyltransferase domain-containing protein [Elusimicrobiota bacterium]